MGHRYANILETIGGTPAVRLNRLAPEHVELFAKVEAFNPMGSVKDRMASNIIAVAERQGKLKPGQTVVEATSGNTGIGLAMVCAAKGYPLVLTMAESFSLERRKILRFLGAKVVLTPADLKGSGMLEKARELAEKHGWFLCRQFVNEANADIHSETTAVEILDDFADRPLDFFVTGYGTGGTLKGTARVLKERSPDTRIVVCEPDNCQLLGSGIPQSENESHPNFRPHLMQGWAPDFIPKLTEDARSAGLIDAILPIDGEEALALTRDLARKEGIFSGVSGGATLVGALKVAASAPAGSTILCMLPDTGERYLSTPVFDSIQVEMNEEELEISRSTPGARFDAPAAASPAEEPAAAPETEPEVEELVDKIIHDDSQPVVLFALAWCEFCWSVRKLFQAFEIPYRSVDLDSVEYQSDDLGGKIRKVLAARTGARTIPQIFVGGEHIGGCTELFEAVRDGSLERRLAAHDLSLSNPDDIDPSGFLPQWLHPR